MKAGAPKISGRERILDAALDVIRAKGYSATSVDDLCARAGVTKGAFFHHFKSKEELAVAAAQHWSKVTNGIFETAPYQAAKDPLERVLGYVDFRKAILRGKTPEFTCLVGTMVQEMFDSSPTIREACERSIFGHASEVAKDIEAAKRIYRPRASWKADDIAHFIQASIQGAFILAKAKGGSEVAAGVLDHVRAYIEHLFRDDPSLTKERT